MQGIPFLKKGVLGAGIAIKVGPMLDWNRFYVLYGQLDNARAVTEDLFAVPSGEAEEAEEEEEGEECAYDKTRA